MSVDGCGDSLGRLEKLLARMPGEDADPAEIEAFMDEVMALEGGLEMIKGLAGPLVDSVDPEEESGYVRPVSAARLVFRVEILGTKPGIWRRFSLPADVSLVDLHFAIQDSFGWLGVGGHHFEVREAGRVEVVFRAKPGEAEFDEVTSPVSELVLNGVLEFHYVYGMDEVWDHLIRVEGAGELCEEAVPRMEGGEGLCPPEGVGGVTGFQRFLAGDHVMVQEYGPELVARIREGEFDCGAVKFRRL